MKKIFLTLAILVGMIASAQVKIGENVSTLNASSILELESSNKGVLFPRVALTSTSSFSPLASHVLGMVVFNTATTGDVTIGMYANDGAKWMRLGSSGLRLKVVSGNTIDFTTGEDIFVFTSTTIVLTLPSPSLYTGKVLYIRNESGSSVNYLVTMPVNITNITATGSQEVYSDGTSWHLIAGKN